LWHCRADYEGIHAWVACETWDRLGDSGAHCTRDGIARLLALKLDDGGRAFPSDRKVSARCLVRYCHHAPLESDIGESCQRVRIRHCVVTNGPTVTIGPIHVG